MATSRIAAMILAMVPETTPQPARPPAPLPTGTTQPVEKKRPDPNGSGRSGDFGDLMMDLGTLVIVGVLIGAVVLVRRWLSLRRRKPLPGLPPERVLPIGRHGTLHDPKYLGSILQKDDSPPPF
ncbi:MAG: hypothetical protein ER33_09575 [Cyanobium sp. CACIAM 14]|nr:MAG: hypothetical protein ER33_09575 [Cyanobium sp. CACIAM 14]